MMKNWTPKDIIALGLLGFIMLYLVISFILALSGYKTSEDAGIRSKEVVIYVVGILSGYIGNHVIKNDKL